MSYERNKSGFAVIVVITILVFVWMGAVIKGFSQWESKCKAANGVPIVEKSGGGKCIVVMGGKLIEKEIK